ncbi:hypothetical protein ACJJTC_015105 [Scirpophaga incertulas]
MHKNLTNTINNTPEKQILRENSVSKSLENYSDKSNQTCTKSIELTYHSSQTIYTKNKYCNNRGSKKKTIILADQQGRGIRQLLLKLAGESFEVFCFMKLGATLTEVLNSVKPQSLNLSENDVLIILGGTNDKNPELLQVVKVIIGFASSSFLTCSPGSPYLPHKKFVARQKGEIGELGYHLRAAE